MLVSESYKYNQLKWLYSALSGFCAAYFLALFSSSNSIDESTCLFMSTLLFAACFPMFTAFAIAHVHIAEIDLSVEQCEKVLGSQLVSKMVRLSFFLLFFAVAFLMAFFSFWFMLLFIITAILCFVSFGVLILKLREA
ncbi:hypothetical protein B9J93_10435 [Vibrio sp. V17_P4S1T151]|uniref:hypothetical protein n=1 Tax=unclassified Vibrio TaxID=2614977 RepID=UPI000B8E9E44|nr:MULTISPECIES: hypothetical protein [unclassified Vibrio]OXX45797.1 hypothetical protein B9J93_10435 [Vibrio sp. V17_P4S1T151]OXX61931.1 hypothetical protein B9J89_13580 [Vibrio sp. V15_P4S5T153]